MNLQERLAKINKVFQVFLPKISVKLPPEVKAQWLVDLRSGEFDQARSYLRASITPKTLGYCCIGVICNRHGKWATSPKYTLWRANEDVNLIAPLDEKPLLFLGQLPVSMFGVGKEVWIFLARLNDEYHWTFPEIAEWIEEYL